MTRLPRLLISALNGLSHPALTGFLLLALTGLIALSPLAAHAQVVRPGQRPAITGISHMCVYTSDPSSADHFYGAVLKGQKAADPEDAKGVRYYFSATQFVEVLPLPTQNSISRMCHVAYNTTSVERMRTYLAAKGETSNTEIEKGSDGSQWFETRDPEGNIVQFVQPGMRKIAVSSAPISTHIIHAGLEVHSRAAEDRFYRDILGFRPYWYGAMKDNAVDWVSQQVPDGHDWVEYMLVGDGSTTPLAKVDGRELGVMNHFSLGVPNMEQAVTALIKYDRLSPRQDGPQMGRDGKWQANLYDPDGTRVELMEFQPVTKPCCSDFTASSPTR
jgi:catechol 2,3-dioxygenase-like lactoylglutathione lyase family enzyme